MMRGELFQSAVLRLTLWYVLIIFILSMLFSMIVYSLASHEFERAFGPRRAGEMSIFIESDIVAQLRQERINDSNNRLVLNLLSFNIATLLLGGVSSYLLARRTLQPIENALEMQARFSSDAAHELRTPLAIMRSEAEVVLRDKKAEKSQLRETLQSNLDEVDRLQILTSRLLQLSERHELQLTSVAVDEAASDALTRLVPLAQAKSISIDNQVKPVQAIGNYDAIVDVLGILIDNAIKYSPEKTTIVISGEQRDGKVEIRVTDQGEGIDKNDVERVFDRFYRVDTSRSRSNVEGNGLGLSIASRLMQAQKGTIHLESMPKKGSTFTLRFPAA